MIVLKIYSIVILLLGIIASGYKAVEDGDKTLITAIIMLAPVLFYIICR